MSRSTKKPYVSTKRKPKDVRKNKRWASKTVRKEKDASDGKSYKKYFCSWEICDYICYYPQEKKSFRK